jgi:hypothetical protein
MPDQQPSFQPNLASIERVEPLHWVRAGPLLDTTTDHTLQERSQ